MTDDDSEPEPETRYGRIHILIHKGEKVSDTPLLNGDSLTIEHEPTDLTYS